MEPLALLRRSLVGLAGTAAGLTALAIAAQGNEVSGREHVDGAGLVIHGPEETLRTFCRGDAASGLFFVLPGGASYELVTSPDHPAITNRGDGVFHPYDPAVVRAAFEQVRFPLEDIGVEVFVLPFPRVGGLESAAGPGFILLSPGVRSLSAEHQHAEFVHELGHVVQYALMPDADPHRWAAYRGLRNILDETVYSRSSPHGQRPHEIFAEDFRALFGGALANYSGTIENASLPHPGTVPGLRDFMLGLASAAPGFGLIASPNPTRGDVSFAMGGTRSVLLDVFDAQGRRVASLEPSTGARGVQWRWDGRDRGDRRAGPGVFFARPRDGVSPAVRVTIVE
jgi:hypothetical protein